jgi:hypothetical protein
MASVFDVWKSPKVESDSRPSDLERDAAAASLGDIRVAEDKPALLQAVVEIDDGAVEVGVELLVHGELKAMDVDDAVALGGVGVDVQAVGETAAPSPWTPTRSMVPSGRFWAVMSLLTSLAAFSLRITPMEMISSFKMGRNISRHDGRAADGLV